MKRMMWSPPTKYYSSFHYCNRPAPSQKSCDSSDLFWNLFVTFLLGHRELGMVGVEAGIRVV